MATEHYPPTAEALRGILARLRAPGGCPWDREQTRQTLSRCLKEEVAELLDAIDRESPAEICDELGDVLMNVVFQAVVAEELGEFTFEDSCRCIIEKMIRRHAHVFGDADAGNPAEVLKLWEKVKLAERGGRERDSVLDGVPQELSALDRGEKLQKKAAKVGFDWSDQRGILDKIEEELAELREALDRGDEAHTDEELGDLLFAASNLARFRKRGTSEELLRAANRKFEERFRYVEERVKAGGGTLEEAGIERMEELWQEAKIVLNKK